MLKKNPSPKRNATSVRKKNSAGFKLYFSFVDEWSRPLMVCGLVLSVMLATALTFRVFEDVFSFPIEAVEVKGELIYQDKKEVAKVIQSFTENGYMDIDMASMKVSLESLPWIRRATVKRNINNDLEVELQEEVVVAYWNDNGFVTDLGDILQVKNRPSISGLPAFRGADHKSLLSVYKQIDEKLFSNMKPMRSLSVNKRNTVRLVLAMGTELVMNVDELEEQLDRWNKIALVTMKGQVSQVRQADLRYSNGAAVSWRESVAQLDNKRSGDH